MRILKSKLPDVVLEDKSITDFVLTHAERLADKAALIEGGSGTATSYATLADRIRRFAGGLKARGVGPGTTWALMAPNIPDYAVAFHGLAYAGACVTTLNPTYGAEEIAFQLGDSKATAIITVGMFLETARKAAAKCGIEEIYVLDDADAPALSTLFAEPLSAQVEVDLADHVVALPYSSGTTGFPKGVMLTHQNLVGNLCQAKEFIEMGEGDVCFAVLPFFHIYGMQVLMNLALGSGSTVVTVPRFDLVQMLELVQTHRITRLYLVPPIVLALAKHPVVDEYDLSSVTQIYSGAAPLSGELASAAAERVGCTIGQGYGMTESSPVTHSIHPSDYKPASVGTILPNTEVRVVDPDSGNDADPGARGEIWVRGPQVMKGYLGNPEATAATLDADGWLHTGDIAVVDDDGHFFIVDRLKELIKVKGFQVAPAELEAKLLSHDHIADAAVIGIPDEEAGERPKAFVVKTGDAALDEAGVVAFAAEGFASYKHLAVVEFIDAIPKSASGKILRRELRART
ncbi:MAG: AMP-binding protein [Myxococcota bacterium]